MTKELMWLTLTIILTGLMWVPYIIDRALVRGLKGCFANPSRHDKPQSAWAQRLYFAHTNAVENLIIFAPLVLILDAQGYSTPYTVIACAVYFWSRLAHAGEDIHAIGNQPEILNALPAPVAQFGGMLGEGDTRHCQKKARIDGFVARGDAIAGERAAFGP